MRTLKYIVIHCSASPENINYTFEQCIKDHKARGFNTCGYHYFITKDGTIHIGRPLDVIGAHVAGHNRDSVGICYEGGLDSSRKPKDTRTEAQKASILKCIKETLEYFKPHQDLKDIIINGHRDFSPDKNKNGIVEPNEWIKVCPCFNAIPEYKWITI
jgi:N-acetylmuramoyl-L-alanine amidase